MFPRVGVTTGLTYFSDSLLCMAIIIMKSWASIVSLVTVLSSVELVLTRTTKWSYIHSFIHSFLFC